MKEIDNRYPEYARPYAPVRRSRHHSPLSGNEATLLQHGGRQVNRSALHRQLQRSSLMRKYFTTGAIALIAVVLILFGVSAALYGDFHIPQNMGAGFWWLVVLGGLGQTGIYFFYYRNLKHFEVWLVKLFLLLMPVLSCFIGVFFLNEELTVMKMLGILVVLSGAAIILQRGRINREDRLAKNGL